MEKLVSVQRALEHIETNLPEIDDLREISDKAAMSHYSFQRTFKALTGSTLMRYVRGRRLDRALTLLEQTELRILDVAVVVGYESQEAFARIFKRAFGLTPRQFRKEGRRTTILGHEALGPEALAHRAHQSSLIPEISHHPELTLVGLLTTYDGTDRQRNTLGEDLYELWQAFVARAPSVPDIKPGPFYGAIRESVDGNHLEYLAGASVVGDQVPEDMVKIVIPAGPRALFTHSGFPTRVDETVNHIYSTWLLHSDYHHPGSPDLEIYGREWKPNSKDSVIHYSVPLGRQSR